MKHGSRERDFELYAEWGEQHTAKARLNAARAAFCLLWGADWDATATPSYVVNGVDRLLAFAGDHAAERVALDWALIRWADIDGGSTELVAAAKRYTRRSFRPPESPSGWRYWSNTYTLARVSIERCPIDYAARIVVASDALDEIEQTLGGKE